MEGVWRGVLDQSLDASQKKGYQMYWAKGLWEHGNPTHFLTLTLEKEPDGQYVGFYEVALRTDTTDHARFTAIANYKDSILTYKTLDKILERSKYIYCFNQSDLRYRFDADFEYLEGEWKGWSYRGKRKHPCADGTILLKRPRIRATKIVREIKIPTAKLKIKVWDNDREDGDVITLKINQIEILSKHELTQKKHKINVKLDKIFNTLVLKAENLGEIPPNTATIEIQAGKFRKIFVLNSDMNQSEALKIEVE